MGRNPCEYDFSILSGRSPECRRIAVTPDFAPVGATKGFPVALGTFGGAKPRFFYKSMNSGTGPGMSCQGACRTGSGMTRAFRLKPWMVRVFAVRAFSAGCVCFGACPLQGDAAAKSAVRSFSGEARRRFCFLIWAAVGAFLSRCGLLMRQPGISPDKPPAEEAPLKGYRR